MLREPKQDTDIPTKASKESKHVDAKVWYGNPVELHPVTDEGSEGFTKNVFECELDKVSRLTGRGKLAHLRPNSEEFARRKQEEIDFEERSR